VGEGGGGDEHHDGGGELRRWRERLAVPAVALALLLSGPQDPQDLQDHRQLQ
jgi:hypothetical protein